MSETARQLRGEASGAGAGARRFLAAFASTLALLALLLFPGWLFLFHVHELDDVRDVARRQLERGGLYGSGVREDTARHKLALLEGVRPEVVAVGSSRVMQLSADMFGRSFVNLGGAVQSLAEADAAVAAMLSRHRPRVILVGLDFFWWNEAWPQPAWSPPEDDPGPRLTAANLLRPFKWLATRKVPPRTYLEVVLHDQRDFGVQAVLLGNGFGPDGHRAYGGVLDGREPSWDPRFSDYLARVATGTNRMQAGDLVDEERWRQWERVAERLRGSGARVLTFMPPVADPVREAMERGGRHRYVDALRARLSATHLAGPHVDLHDAAALATSPCEFYDGLHGGAVTYARVLQRLAAEAGIADVVDAERLGRIVGRAAGHASVGPDGTPPPVELDFLQLGCKK